MYRQAAINAKEAGFDGIDGEFYSPYHKVALLKLMYTSCQLLLRVVI
jgi:hypothetical protein